MATDDDRDDEDGEERKLTVGEYVAAFETWVSVARLAPQFVTLVDGGLAELRATLAESREREVATRRTALELERAIIDGASAQVAALPHLRTDATDRIPGLVRRLIGDAGGSDGRVG